MIAPTFSVTGGSTEPHAAVPTLRLGLAVELRDGGALEGMTLFCQARLEPQRRGHHSPAEEARLQDLFGARVRWPATMKSLPWVESSLFVPPFERRAEVTLTLPCSYDLEVSASKYFHSLDGGEVPLRLLFRGTMYARSERGLMMSPLPWSCEAAWGMPLQLWRAAVEDVFPDAGWLRLSKETIDALLAFKGSRALGSWDGVIQTLLEKVKS